MFVVVGFCVTGSPITERLQLAKNELLSVVSGLDVHIYAQQRGFSEDLDGFFGEKRTKQVISGC